eukprot:gene8645-17833_t
MMLNPILIVVAVLVSRAQGFPRGQSKALRTSSTFSNPSPNSETDSQPTKLSEAAKQFPAKISLIASGIGLSSLISRGQSVLAADKTLSKVVLPKLPYPYDALEPYISNDTLFYHHDKHHAKYVATTNAMIAETELENADLITIIRKSYGTNQGLFNNAAQSYNHDFYWKCMKPSGGGVPGSNSKILSLINKSFGSYDNFREQFATAGNTLFGSGWAWLVYTPAGLKIVKTSNADTPLTEADAVPLLTMDVWEHAYYLDYQNVRGKYVDAFLDKLINWNFVESQIPKSLDNRKVIHLNEITTSLDIPNLGLQLWVEFQGSHLAVNTHVGLGRILYRCRFALMTDICNVSYILPHVGSRLPMLKMGALFIFFNLHLRLEYYVYLSMREIIGEKFFNVRCGHWLVLVLIVFMAYDCELISSRGGVSKVAKCGRLDIFLPDHLLKTINRQFTPRNLKHPLVSKPASQPASQQKHVSLSTSRVSLNKLQPFKPATHIQLLTDSYAPIRHKYPPLLALATHFKKPNYRTSPPNRCHN